MRLTLRRLLAYLDDILDPSDQEAIRAKIDESEFATDLLHRTRDAMRRLRLGAPAVLGGDGGLDPNTVAEYLDHTLPQEQVEDFERFCLESDIHLAEAGSCHQILTMVLGEPAEIEPESRQRIYSIPTPVQQEEEHRVEPPHVPAGAPPEPDAPPVTTTRAAVPDYLRPSFAQRNRGKLAAIAIAVIGIAVFFLRPVDETPVPKEMADAGDLDSLAPPEVEGGDELLASSADSAGGDAVFDGLDDSGNSDAPPFVPGVPAETSPTPNPDNESGDQPVGDAPPESVDLESDAGSPPPLEDRIVLPPGNAVDTVASDATELDAPMTTEPGANLSDPAIALPSQDLPSAQVPAQGADSATPTDQSAPDLPPDDRGHGASTTLPADAGDPADVSFRADRGLPADPGALPAPTSPELSPDDERALSTTDPDPTKRVAVATYSNDEDILLRFDQEQEGWVRLPDKAELFHGDVLVAVPACRPTISLISGVQVRLDGGSRMVVLGNEDSTGGVPAEGVMGIELVYGRAILLSTLPGPTISLRIGDERATVHFPGAAAELAVEAHRTLPAGSDPLNTPANITADYYAASGRLHYQNESTHFDAAPLSWWHLTPGGITRSTPPDDRGVPKWIAGTMPSRIEKVYSIPGLSAALVEGERIELHLSEVIDHRREEIRWLAGRTSVHVGQFDAPVRALDDPDQRTARPNYIQALKTALAAGPEAAEGVRIAFRRREGADGDELFRMLCGYSTEQIDTVKLKELIQQLEHKKFLFRVLAIHNLKEITGEGDLGYRPEYGVDRRRKTIKKWKGRLDKGELLPVDDA